MQAFIKQRNYPSHVPVIKVPESGEPAEFKALFKQWDPLRTPGQMKAYSNNRIGESLELRGRGGLYLSCLKWGVVQTKRTNHTRSHHSLSHMR